MEPRFAERATWDLCQTALGVAYVRPSREERESRPTSGVSWALAWMPAFAGMTGLFGRHDGSFRQA